MLDKNEIESIVDSLNEENCSSYSISIDGSDHLTRFLDSSEIAEIISPVLIERFKTEPDKAVKSKIKSVVAKFNELASEGCLVSELCKFVFKYHEMFPKIKLWKHVVNKTPQINVFSNQGVGMFGKIASKINYQDAVVRSTHASPKPKSLSVFDDSQSLIKLLSTSIEKKPYYKILCNDECKISISKVDDDDMISIERYCYCPFHSKCDLTNFKTISKRLKNKISYNIGKTSIYGFLTRDGQCYDSCYHEFNSKVLDLERDEINAIRAKLNSALSSIDSKIIEFNKNLNIKEQLKKRLEIDRNTYDKIQRDFTINYGKVSKSSEMIPLRTHKVFTTSITSTENRGKITNTVVSSLLSPLDYTIMSSFFGSRKFQDVSLEHDNINLYLKFSTEHRFINADGDIEEHLDENGNQVFIEHMIKIPKDESLALMRKKTVFKTRKIKNVNLNISKVETNKYKFDISMSISDDTITESFYINSITVNTSLNTLVFGEDNDIFVGNVSISPSYDPSNYRCGIIKIGEEITRNMGIHDFLLDNPEVFFYIGSCFISEHSYINDFINGVSGDLVDIGISDNINEFRITFEDQLPFNHILREKYEDINNDSTIVDFYRELFPDDNLIETLYKIKSSRNKDDTYYNHKIDEIYLNMRIKIYRKLCNISIIDGNILTMSNGDTVYINDEQFVDIAKYYSTIPFLEGDDLLFDDFVINIGDFNSFIDLIKKGLSMLSSLAKKSKKKVIKSNLTAQQRIIDDQWIEEKPSNKLTSDNLKDLSIKEDENDDIKSVTSRGTAMTNLTDKSIDPNTGFAKSRKNEEQYDESLFGHSFIINVISNTVKEINHEDKDDKEDDIVMNGYIAKQIISKYSKYVDYDFDNRTTLYKIDTINVIPENIGYISNNLFNKIESDDEDLPELIDKGDTDDDVYSRYMKAMILFASNTRSFRIRNDKYRSFLNIRHELDKLSPYEAQYKLQTSSLGSKINLPRKLTEFLQSAKKIDSIFLTAQKNLYEKLGDEYFKAIFTAYQTTIDGRNVGINFQTRNRMIQSVQNLINIRTELLQTYSQDYVKFFNLIAEQLVFENFASNIAEFNIYNLEFEGQSYNDLVFPNNSLFSSSIDSISYVSCLPIVIPGFNVTPIITEKASEDLETLFIILYPHNEFITIQDMFTIDIYEFVRSKEVSSKRDKYGIEAIYRKRCACLLLMIKFFEIIDLWRPNKLRRDTLYNKIIELKSAIFEGLIKNKRDIGDDNRIPITSEFDGYYNNLVSDLFDFIGNTNITIRKIIVSDEQETEAVYNIIPSNLLKAMLSIVDKIFTSNGDFIFKQRLMDMNEYVKEFVRTFKTVTYNKQGILEDFRPFSTYDEYDIDKSIANLQRIIGMLKFDKFDNSLDIIRLPDGSKDLISNIDLSLRRDIFNKFNSYLLNATTPEEFKSIRNSFAYYLRTIIPKTTYELYCKRYYSDLFNGNGCELFIDAQSKMIVALNEISIEESNINTSKNKKDKTEKELSELIKTIDRSKDELLGSFSENVSLVDIIIKSYGNEKASYESENAELSEIIDNLKILSKNIIDKFANIDHLYFKILISVFNDNSTINNIRKSIYRDFELTSIDSLNNITKAAIEVICRYINHNKRKVEQLIDGELKSYGLKYNSTINQIKRATLSFRGDERNSIIDTIASYRFVYEFFVFLEIKTDDVKRTLLNQVVEDIIISTSEDKPKIDGYSYELNKCFNRCRTDLFTKNELKILTSNIKYLIERIQNAMTAIDCGPGLHLLSDAIEICVKYLANCNNDSSIREYLKHEEINSYESHLKTLKEDKTEEIDSIKKKIKELKEELDVLISNPNEDDEKTNVVLFQQFKITYVKFINFMKEIGKSTKDVIDSSEYSSFISVINGSLSEMSAITSNIEYFDIIPDVFNRYENITTDLFKALIDFMPFLSTFYDSNDRSHNNDNSNLFIEYFNSLTGYENCDIKFITTLFSDINAAIIPFIDEYIDDNGNVLNDLQVIMFHKDYNLVTRGNYMQTLFKKLNLCILKYIDEKETELIKEIKDRIKNYVELFLSKFKVIKSFDELMIKR